MKEKQTNQHENAFDSFIWEKHIESEFEVIFNQRGSYQGLGRIYGNLGSTLSSIATYKGEPPVSSSAGTFTSIMGGVTYNGVYPAPDGNNYDGTIFYRYFRENNSFKIQYTQSASDTPFDAAAITSMLFIFPLVCGVCFMLVW